VGVSGASGHHNDENLLRSAAPADPAAITRPDMDHPSPDPPPGNMGVAAGVGVPLPASAPPNLEDVLVQELYRTGLMTVEDRAREMAGPLADWMTARFVEWAEKGFQDLPSSEYWSRQVEL
jgi:hypothetical protein